MFKELVVLGELGLSSLVSVNGNVLGESVESLFSLLIVVLLSAESNSNSSRDVSDSLGPEELVESGVDSDILGLHLFLSVLNNLFDCLGSSLLELNSMESFMKVDGVVSSDFVDFFLLSLCHLIINTNIDKKSLINYQRLILSL
jgi:hypothetical protein